MDYKFANNLFLQPCITEFTTERNKRQVFYDLFNPSYQESQVWISNMDFNEIMFYRYIKVIFNMRVKNEDMIDLFDFNGYYEDEVII